MRRALPLVQSPWPALMLKDGWCRCRTDLARAGRLQALAVPTVAARFSGPEGVEILGA
jgi:hypothetical protein